MPKLNYDLTHKLEIYTTNKLIEFINKEVNINDILKEINYEYSFFLDDSSKVAFHVWLSIDYLDKNGKTFIDKYLESNPKSLKPLERSIIFEKNKSFISLFEILKFEDDHIILLDTLQNEKYSVWEPNLNEVLNEGELIFTRIGKVLDEYLFIGEISFLPATVRSMFIEDFLIDFNLRRKDIPDLVIRDYLKKYSLELIKIYNNCIFDVIELDEDLNSYLYDQLDEFEGYLRNKTNNLSLGKHLSNLVEFFDYYLAEDNLSLYNLDQVDFKYFFKEAIENGFINSQEDLNSYLNTLKRYMGFLILRSDKYKDTYLELLNISEDRFSYMERLKGISTPFPIDRLLESYIAEVLNETAISIIVDFDKFILYTVDKPLELTLQKQLLKRKHLVELYEILQDEHTILNKNPNQEDFPLIDMYFRVALALGLMTKDNNKLFLTKKGTNFIRLRDEEKFSLIFTCIWDKEFLKTATTVEPQLIELSKKDLINLVSNLNENETFGVKYIISTYEDKPENLFQISEYLKHLGLVKSNFYPNYTWEITKLGKAVFKYLNEKDTDTQNSSIVQLDNYRNTKKL